MALMITFAIAYSLGRDEEGTVTSTVLPRRDGGGEELGVFTHAVAIFGGVQWNGS
jgi:hypothetical protein